MKSHKLVCPKSIRNPAYVESLRLSKTVSVPTAKGLFDSGQKGCVVSEIVVVIVRVCLEWQFLYFYRCTLYFVRVAKVEHICCRISSMKPWWYSVFLDNWLCNVLSFYYWRFSQRRGWPLVHICRGFILLISIRIESWNLVTMLSSNSCNFPYPLLIFTLSLEDFRYNKCLIPWQLWIGQRSRFFQCLGCKIGSLWPNNLVFDQWDAQSVI
jgi:hypothetical protein